MVIGSAEIKLHIPWSHSLKEKRMVVKSILSKVQNKFNVSVAETGEQDIHQIALIGMACVAANGNQANSMLDTIISFIESASDAEIIDIQKEIL